MQTSIRATKIVPDGINAHRTLVRQRGGLISVAIAAGLTLIGAILLWLPGAIFGVIGYLFINAGLPLLALTGVPAISGTSRYFIAVIGSVAMWWVIGHFAAMRATRRAIAGWPEWRREFQPLAIGVWVGTILALVVTAFVLGAL